MTVLPLGWSGGFAGAAGAALIGLGFGFFLERAGLGDARKLMAQFSGKDMTVFKVMFTAIITAMLGVFWLERVGWLDVSRIHLVPTYAVPQMAGGMVFGAGFVLGGYCPGTSCVAAVSGRMDALILIAGLVLGMFFFALFGPILLPLLEATSLGELTLPEWLGLGPGTVVLAVVVAALSGFVFAPLIEARVRR